MRFSYRRKSFSKNWIKSANNILKDLTMNHTIKDGFKYFTYFMISMACFIVFVVLLTVCMEDGPDEEIRERHKWCEEYHPRLTMEDCYNEAGW